MLENILSFSVISILLALFFLTQIIKKIAWHFHERLERLEKIARLDSPERTKRMLKEILKWL